MTIRVFHRASMQSGDTITLDTAESHYLARVRRARAGVAIEVLDGVARAFTAEIVEVDPSAAKVRIDAIIEHIAAPPIEIAIGLPDPSATLEAIARACELGAARAVLVRCEHSHAAEPGGERTRRVIAAAQRQCGRPDPIAIEGPLALRAWLERPTVAAGFVAWTELRGQPTAVDAVGPDGARVLVGPEGGLSREEIDLCIAHRLTPISLGPWTLRTEVAVVAALSLVIEGYGRGQGHGHGHGAGTGDAR
jgi:16S rRNA (uracil1498-N3)-methyltransferase